VADTNSIFKVRVSQELTQHLANNKASEQTKAQTMRGELKSDSRMKNAT
jgi:hypothetical protein